MYPLVLKGFPGGSEGKKKKKKKSACNAGDPGLIPGFRRYLGKGNDYPLQHSSLENYMDRRAWLPTDHGVAELYTTEQLILSHV